MSNQEIQNDLIVHCLLWDQRSEDRDGHSGSPGEWIVERMDELKTEAKSRGIVIVEPGRLSSKNLIAEATRMLQHLMKDDCGCNPICRCDTEQVLRIWKYEARETVRAVLVLIGEKSS